MVLCVWQIVNNVGFAPDEVADRPVGPTLVAGRHDTVDARNVRVQVRTVISILSYGRCFGGVQNFANSNVTIIMRRGAYRPGYR